MGSSVSVVVAAFTTLGIVLPAFFAGLFSRRRTRADVEVTLSKEAREWAHSFADNARSAMTEAREATVRAARAEARVQDCQERMAAMEVHIARLEAMLRDQGLTPPQHSWERLTLGTPPFGERERST